MKKTKNKSDDIILKETKVREYWNGNFRELYLNNDMLMSRIQINATVVNIQEKWM